MSLRQSNASQDVSTKVVYFAGTETLREGDAMAYDTDDTNAPITSTTLDRKNLRGRRVLTPATALLGGYAGAVAPSSAGVVGPAFIEIIEPRKGDFAFLWTNVNCTKNSTVLGISNAGGRTHVSHADATLNLDMVAVAMQTVDRSSTNGTVLARFT